MKPKLCPTSVGRSLPVCSALIVGYSTLALLVYFYTLAVRSSDNNDSDCLGRNCTTAKLTMPETEHFPTTPDNRCAPSEFVGRIMDVNFRFTSMPSESELIEKFGNFSTGGRWQPEDCQPENEVAVIIPYRDRKQHLHLLLNHLIPVMQRQQLAFRIIVAEQYGNGLFNKGRIMNAAFMFAEQLGADCVLFHDVDMFPEFDFIPHDCPNTPRHLGAYVNVLGYSLWYEYLLGGVVSIRNEHYRRVNGHSNLFWGYGGEDDDFGKRVLLNNLTIERLPKDFARYKMIKHKKRKYAAPKMISTLLNTTESRWQDDGLNRVSWKIVKLVPKPLYYHLYVDVGEPPADWI